tara:strand:+ start:2390 stop:2599 length:210 start_codon:yes stop_codon:yes gene_type:complete
MAREKSHLNVNALFNINIEELFSKKTIVSILMFMTGTLLLFFVGFVQGPADLIHNATHDARHAAGFPCH